MAELCCYDDDDDDDDENDDCFAPLALQHK